MRTHGEAVRQLVSPEGRTLQRESTPTDRKTDSTLTPHNNSSSSSFTLLRTVSSTVPVIFLQPQPVVAQERAHHSPGSWSSVLHERGNAAAAANLGKRNVCDRLVRVLRHGHALQGKGGEKKYPQAVVKSLLCVDSACVRVSNKLQRESKVLFNMRWRTNKQTSIML